MPAEDDLGLIPVPTPADTEQEDLGLVPVAGPTKNPDISGMRQIFKDQIAKATAELKEPKKAENIWEYMEAGWDKSVTGLWTQGKVPDVVLPENAETFANIVAGVSSFAGDVPAMIAGLVGAVPGASVGMSVAGPIGAAVGTVLGAKMGSNALPAGIRTYLMEKYEKGDVTNFKEFYERASAVLYESFKEGTIGTVADLTGGKVAKVLAPGLGKVMSPAVAGTISSRIAAPMAEVGTMATLGAAVEGHFPNAEDFTNGAATVLTINAIVGTTTTGSAKVAGKLRNIYAKTGVRPEQVVQDVKSDPVLFQELLMDSNEIPKVYEEMGPHPLKETSDVAPPAVPKELTVAQEPEAGAVAGRAEEYTELMDVEKVLSNIGEVEVKGDKLSVGEKIKKARESIASIFSDKFAPIKEAVERIKSEIGSISDEKDPHYLANTTSSYRDFLEHIIGRYNEKTLKYEGGTLDFNTGEINGKGLAEIIDPIEKSGKLREFKAFLIAKRYMNYIERGLEPGLNFNVETAMSVINKYGSEFNAHAKEFTDFMHRNLKYAHDAGLFTKKEFENIKNSADVFVNFKRIFEDKPSKGGGVGSGKLAKTTGVSEGEVIKIEDPLSSALGNMEYLIKSAERNRTDRAFIELAERSADPSKYINRVQTSKPTKVSGQEVSKNTGITEAEGFNIWRQYDKNLAKDEIHIMRDGKREVYKVRPEVAEAYRHLGGDLPSMHVAMKFLGAFSNFKRWTITNNPAFTARNLLGDFILSSTISKGKASSVLDMASAMGDVIGKNENYFRALRSRGMSGKWSEVTNDFLTRYTDQLNEKTGFKDMMWNIVKMAEKPSQISETTTRLAKFKNISEGAKSGSLLFKGGRAARESTVNFEESGSLIGGKIIGGASMSSVNAFLNANIRFTVREANAIKNMILGGEGSMEMFKKGFLIITVPTIINWIRNKDDKRVDEIPGWQKKISWAVGVDRWAPATEEDNAASLPDHLKRINNGVMEINSGFVVRVPRLGLITTLFATLPEMILDSVFKDDPRAFNGFKESIMQQALPNMPVTDFGLPLIEHAANRNFFTGRELVPFYLEKVAPAYRYTKHTSETAIQLGKLSSHVFSPDNAAPPAVIDNYIKSWGGSIGQIAVGLIDDGIKKAGLSEKGIGGEKKWSENWFLKSFLHRYPNSQAQSINNFYEEKNKFDAMIKVKKIEAKKIGKDKIDMSEDEIEKSVILKQNNKALKASRKYIEYITASDEYDQRQKTQEIDGQYYLMIEGSKQAIQKIDEINKRLKEGQ